MSWPPTSYCSPTFAEESGKVDGRRSTRRLPPTSETLLRSVERKVSMACERKATGVVSRITCTKSHTQIGKKGEGGRVGVREGPTRLCKG